MLKLFYLCFFISSGVSIPFFPAYLRQIGLSGQQVSLLLAIAPALQLGVPLLWGWIADRTRRPDLVLRALCLGADGALVGRPYLWALAVAGEDGVDLLLRRYHLELENAMALTGCCTVADAGRALLRWYP